MKFKSVYGHLNESGAGVLALFDPDRIPLKEANNWTKFVCDNGVKGILIGSSLLVSPHFDKFVEAVADAAAKAGQLAEVAGIKLGKPVYITENAAFPYPVYRQDYYAEAAMAGAPPTPISPGEMEISVNVQVAYEILE